MEYNNVFLKLSFIPMVSISFYSLLYNLVNSKLNTEMHKQLYIHMHLSRNIFLSKYSCNLASFNNAFSEVKAAHSGFYCFHFILFIVIQFVLATKENNIMQAPTETPP